MPPNPVCPITSGIIEDEIVVFKSERVVFLKKKGIYMSMDEFKECDLANGVIIRIGLADEKPEDTQPTIPKPKKVVPMEPLDLPKPKPFNDSDYAKPEYNLTLDSRLFVASTLQDTHETSADPTVVSIEGIVATVAIALTLLQQVRQKKNDAESKKCCIDNKLKFTEYETKLQNLEVKLNERTKEESKALHAEIYEQYKSLKELRDDTDDLKSILSRVINTIKG